MSVRLAILDWISGPEPTTSADRQREADKNRLQRAFPAIDLDRKGPPQYDRLSNKSLMRRPTPAGQVILTGGHCIIPVLLMLDGGADRFYDKAERDRQHALRRIRLRKTRSNASWAMLRGLSLPRRFR
jgi:hypothetical protein